jgi:hypothetical protein
VDLTNPVIGVTAYAGVVTVGMEANLVRDVARAPADEPVLFNVTILENVGVGEATITIQGNKFALSPTGGSGYAFSYTNATVGNVTLNGVEVYARDVNGREARFSFDIQLNA